MKKLVVLISLSLLAACSPKKSSVKSNVNAAAASGSVFAGTQCPAGSTNTANNVGSIYDTTMNSYNFENQVKLLLSATISPYDVGMISSQGNASTGVRFSGTIKLDASGNVLGGNQSSAKITVYDSFWLANQTDSNKIVLDFNPSRGGTISGQFNLQSGDGTLTLQDQYGQVTFTGRLDAQSFSGTVSFQNNVTVLQNTQPASGNLGQFYVQRCALFQ